MSKTSLPILVPGMPWQKYSCHGCGDCCRDFTVQLRDRDLKKLASQGWSEKIGIPITQTFRGSSYLARQDDGACIFLDDEGLCRIHAEFGFEEKPIACQVFPFNIAPDSSSIRVGVNFLCKSVQQNRGAGLESHRKDLKRFVHSLPELNQPTADPPLTSDINSASRKEIDALVGRADTWLCGSAIDLPTRLDGLAFIATCLGEATLKEVRQERFVELVDTLFSVLPDELHLQPIESATRRQQGLLRQAVFTRTEDPRIDSTRGRLSAVLSQLMRSRSMRRGRGCTPHLTPALPEGVDFRTIEGVASFDESPEADSISELWLRYIRASLFSGRLWGSAYYGWSVVDGLQALILNLACISWLAKLSSASEHRPVALLKDYQLAIGRVDRQVGRAPWLGNPVEKTRLSYFRMNSGFRRILRHYL